MLTVVLLFLNHFLADAQFANICGEGTILQNNQCKCIDDINDTTCPEGCKVYFDGCNICQCGEITVCTRKACAENKPSYCMDKHCPSGRILHQGNCIEDSLTDIPVSFSKVPETYGKLNDYNIGTIPVQKYDSYTFTQRTTPTTVPNMKGPFPIKTGGQSSAVDDSDDFIDHVLLKPRTEIPHRSTALHNNGAFLPWHRGATAGAGPPRAPRDPPGLHDSVHCLVGNAMNRAIDQCPDGHHCLEACKGGAFQTPEYVAMCTHSCLKMYGHLPSPNITTSKQQVKPLSKKNPLRGIVSPGGHDPAASDDRVEVCSDGNPRGKVVRIIYKNSGAVCTGTLVGPSHVLTAGHCLYNFDGKGASTNAWLDIKGILLTPCLSDSSEIKNKPDSPRPTDWQDAPIDFDWEWARTVKGWTKKGKWEYDYGMIKLRLKPNQKQTGRGWMSFGYDNSLPKYSFNLNGYPGASAPTTAGDDDKLTVTVGGSTQKVFWTGFEMAWDYDRSHAIKNKLLEYYIDTWGGQSGSGVYAYFSQSNRRVIFGVHRGWDGSKGELKNNEQDESEYNVAKRITSDTFVQLCGWIDDTRVC